MKKKILATKQDIKAAKELCKGYNILPIFNPGTGGTAACWESEIDIGKDSNREDFWSTVCHEICHVLNYRAGIFPVYHGRWSKYNEKQKIKVRQTALRAELFTDDMGKKLYKLLKLPGRYQTSYRDADDQAYLRVRMRDIF